MQKLYHGKNTFLSLRAVHNTLDTELKENEIIKINADSIDPTDIIDKIYSPTLFSSSQIYFIKRPYRNKEKEFLLNSILEILSQKSISLIIWEDQKIRSNTKYYKFFKENDAIEEFKELNKRTFMTWAKKELSNYPFSLEYKLIKTLAERSNYEPERFINNLTKLKLLDEKQINTEILDQVVADTLQTDIWKLMDSINQSNHKEINKTLEKLLEYKVDPNYILAMIARNLRISIQVKELLKDNLDVKKIASKLKLPPFAVYPIAKSVKQTSKEKILLEYKKLANLDYEIKTGRIDPILGLSLFTLVL
jgi:DNA polymerase-3 subunit delta